MASWRRHAAQALPELWEDEDDRSTPHLFFFTLVPFVRDAHRRGDDDALGRAYGFARWCLRQGGDLGNAVAVSFYEHLFDSWDVHRDVLRCLDDATIRVIWPLWAARLEPEQLRIVRAS